MSGPKLSAAEIERRRQEQLERERQEALRRLREAQKAYRTACGKIEDVKRYSLSLLQQVDAMYRADAQKEVDSILASLMTVQITDDKDPQAYLSAANVISKNTETALTILDKRIAVYLANSKTDQKLSNANTAHQSFHSYITLKSDPIDVLSIDFKSDYDQKQLLNKVDQVFIHYKWLSTNGQSDSLRQFGTNAAGTIQNILTQRNQLQRSEIIARIQTILNEEGDILRRDAEKAACYDDYVALATLMNIIPKALSDFSGIQAIQKDIADLNCKLRKKDEMDYIADQINDAMVSLGYGLVTSSVLTRKDQSEMDCSLYQADDQTGIAIYTDQTGAVMMRMTVLGNDTDITDVDRDFSLQRQIDFCAGHADIVEALAKRGVFLKQKSYLAPDKKHTYKVNMNATGTTIQKDANGRTVLKKDMVDRRKRRRANKKKMRAM
jgi:hypothetical protein